MKTNPSPSDKLEHRPIDKLIPYAKNSRTHSPEQVAQIAASIKEWGFTSAVLVDEDGGIIAGHGRVQAARKLGMETVPVMVAKGWTDAQKRAYVIADNKLALNSGWDMDMLRLELGELDAAGFDLELTGFSLDEIAGLEPDVEVLAPGSEPDETPELKEEAITKRGDVWVLGNHRVMCGDSTIISDVEKLMNGKKAQLLHADPPYGMGKQKDGVENDNIYRDDLVKFQMEWWATYRTFIEDNASAYIWGNAEELWRLWYGGLKDGERLTFRNEIVWNKGGGQGQMSDNFRSFAPATERVLFFMVGEQGFNNNTDNYWEGFEPIRAYLSEEKKKSGLTNEQILAVTNTSHTHYWTKSQWAFPTEDHYKVIQKVSNGGAFKKDYDELKKDYDELKKEFYGTRAYFDNTHDNMTDVWEFQRVTGEERHGHATPKPVEMMERIMMSSLQKGGLCVEPFGGSGSTLISAQTTGRVCYSMELTPNYVDVIVKRWQKLTGKTATLESDGRTFEEVKEASCP